MIEHTFRLPGERVWVVRAFHYSEEEAKSIWETIQAESRGKHKNFSIWRTTNPDHSVWLVVLCGEASHLPALQGEAYELSFEEARSFALRRARVGLEGVGDEKEWLEQEMRYEEGMVIDRSSGEVKPYRG